MLSLVDRAIGFAARAHQDQRRKIGKVPYIAHPFGVAVLLMEMGCDETVVAAGLLHDTVEDTQVTLEEIRERFGDDVADIVSWCTEPSKKDNNWESRKLHTVKKLRQAPLSAKLVTAADKYHNLSHTLNNRRADGSSIWWRFGRGKEQQAWYYRAVLESITTDVPDIDRYPIFARLAEVIEELFDGIPSQPPDQGSGDTG